MVKTKKSSIWDMPIEHGPVAATVAASWSAVMLASLANGIGTSIVVGFIALWATTYVSLRYGYHHGGKIVPDRRTDIEKTVGVLLAKHQIDRSFELRNDGVFCTCREWSSGRGPGTTARFAQHQAEVLFDAGIIVEGAK